MSNSNDKHFTMTEFITNREDAKFHVMSGGTVYLYERKRKRFAFVAADVADRASAEPGEEYAAMRERAESAERSLIEAQERNDALQAELDAVRATQTRIAEMLTPEPTAPSF